MVAGGHGGGCCSGASEVLKQKKRGGGGRTWSIVALPVVSLPRVALVALVVSLPGVTLIVVVIVVVAVAVVVLVGGRCCCCRRVVVVWRRWGQRCWGWGGAGGAGGGGGCHGGGGCSCGWLIEPFGLFWVTRLGPSDRGYLIPDYSESCVGK
jgi:hypothetical protein